jgi:hypothetical protein
MERDVAVNPVMTNGRRHLTIGAEKVSQVGF